MASTIYKTEPVSDNNGEDNSEHEKKAQKVHAVRKQTSATDKCSIELNHQEESK